MVSLRRDFPTHSSQERTEWGAFGPIETTAASVGPGEAIAAGREEALPRGRLLGLQQMGTVCVIRKKAMSGLLLAYWGKGETLPGGGEVARCPGIALVCGRYWGSSC